MLNSLEAFCLFYNSGPLMPPGSVFKIGSCSIIIFRRTDLWPKNYKGQLSFLQKGKKMETHFPVAAAFSLLSCLGEGMAELKIRIT